MVRKHYENANKWRTMVRLLRCVLCMVLLAGLCWAASPNGLVPRQALPHLLLGERDLPVQGTLFALDGFLASNGWFHELWLGPPTGRLGTVRNASHSVRVDVVILPSAQLALNTAIDLRMQVAVPPREASDRSFAAFSDRAWYAFNMQTGSGRILFVRGNVMSDVYLSCRGLDEKPLLAMARRLGRKIDAVRAGRPEPVPVLPLAADQELRVDLEGAWRLRDLGRRLWGDRAPTIALYDTNGLPRSLPALRVGEGDYTVPLRHLAAVLGRQYVKVPHGKGPATVTLCGKALALQNGERRAQVDGRAISLSRPVQFVEGEVLVPLSLVEQVLGRRMEWQRVGGMMRGRVKPSRQWDWPVPRHSTKPSRFIAS